MPSFPTYRNIDNFILDRLPDQEYGRIAPHLRLVPLELRQVIHQIDEEMDHVYFPTTALSSLLTVLEAEDPVEAAAVGREGFIGAVAGLDLTQSPHRVICQMPGESFRLPIEAFHEALAQSPVLSRLVSRYHAYLMRYFSQGIACNALHMAEARAARWLLISHDQARADEFALTQEFLGVMLGVRRQGVTVITGVLQNAGIIAHRRGHFMVLDRGRLEEVACECYAATRAYHERVMG
ncbi:Crp/Fnr family transcriptional regulator [Tundrisphaera sp. TA3]|uniref:Crp/Fnr family transcriptional regulator n=1 Tax=Tundrisphaera sp. TA3 TaxID=3435775 RepID=UPI003EB8986B